MTKGYIYSEQLVAEELKQPLNFSRNLFGKGMTILAFALTALALLPLFAILFKIFEEGIGRLSWGVLVNLPAPVDMSSPTGFVDGRISGFANAIVGTVIMVAIASIISIPVGVLTGVFLSEFGKDTAFSKVIRFMVVVLSSVPSIVVGIFAFGVVVVATGGVSAIAGGFALSVIMLPIIALSTEEALKLVPLSYRLASAALGGGRFQTTFRIVLTTALPAITTGILLAISRAAGETAPLLFTARSSQFWLQSLLEPTPSMSVLIYGYAISPFKQQNDLAWSAAAVLLVMVLLFNILSRIVTRKRQ